MAELYLKTVNEQIGADAYRELATAVRTPAAMKGLAPEYVEAARAIAYLWYTGAWPRIAPAAHAALRRQVANDETMASPSAYTEGLVWRTFHSHPGGAKPPGFGTWSMRPPEIPDVDGIFADLPIDRAGSPTAFTDADSVATIDASALPGPASEYYYAAPSGRLAAAEPEAEEQS